MNKKIFSFLIFTLIFGQIFSQDFYNTDYNPAKAYILITNPTVENIDKIILLIDNHILFAGDTEFIGIYFYSEKYDYNQSVRYIKDNNLEKFHLQRLAGYLSVDNIFSSNEFTSNFDIMFSQSKGIFLFDGPDIMPELYGEKNTHSDVINSQRQLFELSLVFHLLGSDKNPEFKPFLEKNPKYSIIGFGTGMHIMNIASGGTLIQDIPSELYDANTPQEIVQLDQNNLHRNYWKDIFNNEQLANCSFHHLRLEAGGFFIKEVGWRKSNVSPPVLSLHHQAVENLSDIWKITARSMDGRVIEGISHKKYPNVFGVQFLPDEPTLFYDDAKYKSSPRDIPRTHHNHIGKDGVKFHKQFWKRVSKAIN